MKSKNYEIFVQSLIFSGEVVYRGNVQPQPTSGAHTGILPLKLTIDNTFFAALALLVDDDGEIVPERTKHCVDGDKHGAGHEWRKIDVEAFCIDQGKQELRSKERVDQQSS